MKNARKGAMKNGDRVSAIAAVLQDNIVSGYYAPGDRLPSEADLCAHFDVSRPTLREALGRLTARGLITARRGAGGGAFVTQPTLPVAADQIAALVAMTTRAPEDAHLPLLTEARALLSMACAELAVMRQADIADIRAEIDLQSDFTIAEEDFMASIHRMHVALAIASGNPALTILAQGLIDAEFALAPTDNLTTRVRARFLSYHVRVANGIAGGRADDARAALTELWAYEQQRLSGAGDEPQPVERPPKMRDLRLPPVQRITPLDPPTAETDDPAGTA